MNKIFLLWRRWMKWNRTENNINYCEALDLMRNHADVILLDVRSQQEYQEYHLKHSMNIPLYELKIKAEKLLKKDSMIIVYCQSGTRSKKACKCLDSLGYHNLYHLQGGLDEI